MANLLQRYRFGNTLFGRQPVGTHLHADGAQIVCQLYKATRQRDILLDDLGLGRMKLASATQAE